MGDRKINQDDWDQIIMGVPEGMRHMSAVRLAGRYYGKGMSVKEVRVILTLWNEDNLPPMDHHEMEFILKSTEKWENLRDVPPMSDEEVNEIVRLVKKRMNKRR